MYSQNTAATTVAFVCNRWFRILHLIRIIRFRLASKVLIDQAATRRLCSSGSRRGQCESDIGNLSQSFLETVGSSAFCLFSSGRSGDLGLRPGIRRYSCALVGEITARVNEGSCLYKRHGLVRVAVVVTGKKSFVSKIREANLLQFK